MQYKDYPVGNVEEAEIRRVMLLEEHGFEDYEVMEVRADQYAVTGFPNPVKRYFMSLQTDKLNLEHHYYWMIGHVMNDFNLPYAIKVSDSTAASVSSSTFGDMQARLSAQQGSVSNYLASVGKMVRDLFSLVRELRQIRERLGYYKEAELKDQKNVADAAEKTLKGIWVDLVEGGTQNPSSVIGLAQKVGFTVLPDLFFSAPPLKESHIHAYVYGGTVDNIKYPGLDFNTQVKNMLERKLYQFGRWKIETKSELEAKQRFQLRYLRQHFDSIRMYLAWLKPYLRHVEMLSLDQQKMQNDPWLVSSFQSQIMELETLVHGNPMSEGVHPVVIFHFYHRSTPSLDFHAKEAWQQKGPIHIGKTEIVIRVYAWTAQEIEKYIKMRRKEEFTLLESIDNSLKDAIQLMDKDIVEFLKESGEDLPESWLPESMRKKEEKKKEEPKRESLYASFNEIGKGMADIFKPLVPSSVNMKNWFGDKEKRSKQENKEKMESARKAASGTAGFAAWNAYKNYKKAHGHFSW